MRKERDHDSKNQNALSGGLFIPVSALHPFISGRCRNDRFVSSDDASGVGGRDSDIGTIQRALETQIVKEKLKAHGMAPDEINSRMQDLTDEQIHLLAQASDAVLAGGDSGLGIVIAILVIVLLVILILKLSDKSIVVK